MIAPRPPGSYRLAFDLVEEFRFWFAELGLTTLDLPIEVLPLIEERRLTVNVYGPVDAELEAALSAQEEPLVTEDAVAVAHFVSGVVPAPDWSRLILDAHAEGYAVVGPAIAAESPVDRRSLAAGGPGGGRNPRFGEPLPLLVAPRRSRAHDARGPPCVRAARRPLRGPCRCQTSVAIRSSERLKTRAPSASATPAATTVYRVSPAPGASP